MCWSQHGWTVQKIFGLPKPVFSHVPLGIFLLISNVQSDTQTAAQYFWVPQKLWECLHQGTSDLIHQIPLKRLFLSSWNSFWRRGTDCCTLSWVFLLSLWEFPGFLAEDLLVQQSSCRLLRFLIVVSKFKQIAWIAEYQWTRFFRKVVFTALFL